MRFTMLLVLVLAPTILLAAGAWSDLHVSDAEIAGAAPEDLLGFGHWLAWIPLAALELFAWLFLRASAHTSRRRVIARAAIIAFAVSSMVSYWSYLQLYNRVIN